MPMTSTTGLMWRADDNGGVAHACRRGFATALCGAQADREVAHGTPCPRCLVLATDYVLRHEAG